MIESMENKDWLMIAAVIVGPILAVQAQKLIEALRSKKQRRLNLFFTLMSTRATRLAPDHVGSLNMIDIEFYGRRMFGVRLQTPSEKKVTNSWKTYNDHLNNNYPEDRLDAWHDKADDLFTVMLYAMSQALGYDFDEVQLKRDCYRPKGHGELEDQQYAIRAGVVDLLAGKRSLPMAVTYFPDGVVQSETKDVQDSAHNKKMQPTPNGDG